MTQLTHIPETWVALAMLTLIATPMERRDFFIVLNFIMFSSILLDYIIFT